MGRGRVFLQNSSEAGCRKSSETTECTGGNSHTQDSIYWLLGICIPPHTQSITRIAFLREYSTPFHLMSGSVACGRNFLIEGAFWGQRRSPVYSFPPGRAVCIS